MKPQPRRRASYNDSAEQTGQEPAAPPQSHGCSAYGCPVVGSIIVNGMRKCFVHLAILEMKDWDAATHRIRARMPFVDAIDILRSQGTRTDEQAVSDARDLVPALDEKHDTRYKAQLALESRLTAIAKGGEQLAYEPPVVPNLVAAAAAQFLDSHRIQP